MVPTMVLCAGLGTRLRPLTNSIPKPMLPIGDRPALAHILDALAASKAPRIVVNTHHCAEEFRDLEHDSIELIHETELLGTAGAIHNASGALGRGAILVWNGDIFLRPDLSKLLARHRQTGADATLLVAPRPVGQGRVGLDSRARIVRLRETAIAEETTGGDYVGVMAMGESTRNLCPRKGCLVGDVLLPLLGQGGHIAASLHEAPWIDVGTPETYLEANLAWLRWNGRTEYVGPGVQGGQSVVLHDCVVGRGAEIRGLGRLEQCVVLPNATVLAPARRTICHGRGECVGPL